MFAPWTRKQQYFSPKSLVDWSVYFAGITWTNTEVKIVFDHSHQAALEDMDGSLTGTVDAKIVPYNPTLNPDVCAPMGSNWSSGMEAYFCNTPLSFHRFTWHQVWYGHPGSKSN